MKLNKHRLGFQGPGNNVWLSLALVLILASPNGAKSEEISLYDRQGEAVAYIATDADLTIYTWEGKAVAYLHGEDIYGYNGKHLGWFEEGIIWDHAGRAAGFLKGAINIVTRIERIKGLKELRSLKSLKELAPLKRVKSKIWSPIPLTLFLVAGAN